MSLNLPPLAGSASPLADSDPFSTSSQNTTDLPAYLQGPLTPSVQTAPGSFQKRTHSQEVLPGPGQLLGVIAPRSACSAPVGTSSLIGRVIEEPSLPTDQAINNALKSSPLFQDQEIARAIKELSESLLEVKEKSEEGKLQSAIELLLNILNEYSENTEPEIREYVALAETYLQEINKTDQAFDSLLQDYISGASNIDLTKIEASLTQLFSQNDIARSMLAKIKKADRTLIANDIVENCLEAMKKAENAELQSSIEQLLGTLINYCENRDPQIRKGLLTVRTLLQKIYSTKEAFDALLADYSSGTQMNLEGIKQSLKILSQEPDTKDLALSMLQKIEDAEAIR